MSTGSNPMWNGKKMLYLTTHSTHFIYGYMASVKDHSDSEKGNPLPTHRLLFLVILYASSHREHNTHHGLCYTSRGALAGTRPTQCDWVFVLFVVVVVVKDPMGRCLAFYTLFTLTLTSNDNNT